MFRLVEQKKIVYLDLCEEGKIIFAVLNWKMHVTPPIETVIVPLGVEISLYMGPREKWESKEKKMFIFVFVFLGRLVFILSPHKHKLW